MEMKYMYKVKMCVSNFMWSIKSAVECFAIMYKHASLYYSKNKSRYYTIFFIFFLFKQKEKKSLGEGRCIKFDGQMKNYLQKEKMHVLQTIKIDPIAKRISASRGTRQEF